MFTESTQKCFWAGLRYLVRFISVVIGIALLGVTGLALISAVFMINFGGFFQRMEGWQIVTGSLFSLGIAVGCLQYKPKFGLRGRRNDASIKDTSEDEPSPNS